ncbi:bifunctional DNA primase/polymerase [Bradyrhizobium sp. 131]|uniref:bifunctional DNA primase/polymerase n=1 Tax=Bradyrhizobium sp. 131 TaxID=2782609 RepID=UPI001FFF545E|nr:bifunctional DNA primase/polymerase [Bradyrhizobium sp. 131]UPK16791.1 bifunctional DNA primase/polymerase [Bradyrhizobium sp. 131]
MASPFALIALGLIERGYSPLPIAPWGEQDWNPKGKEPGRLEVGRDGELEWYRLKNWQLFCDRQAHPKIIEHWSTWPEAGIGLATGFGGLVAVDVDDDSLIDPILGALPPVLVAKRGRKGMTAFYRAVEPLPSKNYRTTDKRGLLDFLSAGKQTVIPKTPHPAGGWYEWTTDRTLLDTPLSDLPLLTGAHVAAMEEILRAHGWDAREQSRPRGAAPERPARGETADESLWHDDVNTVALARLPSWLPALGLPKTRPNGVGYRAVAPWRGSGSGRSEARRQPNLSFHPTGIQDFGTMETFTPIRVVAKAKGTPYSAAAAWLRQQLGLPDERLILLRSTKSSSLPPTYPDRAVSLADATTELRGALDGFEAQMKAWRVYRNQTRLTSPLIHRKPPVWGVKIEAGGGKSFQAARNVAAWTRRGWRLAYVVPRIDLGEKIGLGLGKLGIKAQVYRGREQADPDAPGQTMCQNLPAAAAAVALGVSVRPAVCMRRIDEKLVQCPLATVCGHERQREAKPDVWIITAASLLYEKPDFLPELDGLVIDEKFHDSSVGNQTKIDTTELWRAKIELCSDEEHDFLLDMRAKLLTAAENNGAGALSRAVLDEHGFFPHTALRAAILEQRLVKPDVLRPGMKESGFNLALRKHSARNRLAREAGALWNEIAMFLAFDHQHSGRISLTGSTFTFAPLRPFHLSWWAPVLALDATLTTPEILHAAVLGDEVAGIPVAASLKADIAIQWPDHVRVRQVTGAPVPMGALGIGENAKPHPRNERNILRYIRQQAALIAPARLGVISYLGLEERFAGQVPANVSWMHFGATSGLNDFETVAGLVVIGRWWLSPDKVEARASVFAGYPVKPIGEFYRKRTGGIRMTEGPSIAASVECHPDPFAEAVRRGVTEDELEQAIGRLRPHRRTDPCFLDLVGDVVLPVTVDEVVEWDAVCPGAEADMLAQGVVLFSKNDAIAAFGVSKREAEEVREVSPTSLNSIPIRDLGLTSPDRQFTYQKAGPGQKPNTGLYLPGILPGGVPALRGWLEERLGPLASLEVARMQSRATFAKSGREAAGSLKFASGFSPALSAIAAFVRDLEQCS